MDEWTVHAMAPTANACMTNFHKRNFALELDAYEEFISNFCVFPGDPSKNEDNAKYNEGPTIMLVKKNVTKTLFIKTTPKYRSFQNTVPISKKKELWLVWFSRVQVI